jgi:hypothetical protein
LNAPQARIGDDILLLTSTCVLRYAPHALDAERLPSPSRSLLDVFDIVGRARDDLYVSGWANDHRSGFRAPFIEHFDGHTWSLVPQPPAPAGHWRLAGVVRGGVVAVGTRRTDLDSFEGAPDNDALDVFDETAHEWCNIELPNTFKKGNTHPYRVVPDGDGVWMVTRDETNPMYEAFYATAVRAGGH